MGEQGQMRVRALEQAWAWPLLSSTLGLVDTAWGRQVAPCGPKGNVISKSQYWHRRPRRGQSGGRLVLGSLAHSQRDKDQLSGGLGGSPSTPAAASPLGTCASPNGASPAECGVWVGPLAGSTAGDAGRRWRAGCVLRRSHALSAAPSVQVSL